MKVGIVTYHFPYNCGAVLQCTALQTKLEQLGIQTCVINYRPWYHQNRYTHLKNPLYFAHKQMCKKGERDVIYRRVLRGIKGFLRTIYSWRNYRKNLPRHKKFNVFTKKYLNQTKVYRNIEQLRANPPKCDLYICGSDQLWNTNITEGKFDPAYFLHFGDDKTLRASYSVGVNFEITKDIEDELKVLLSKFDFLSLRESKYKEVIQRNIQENIFVSINIDPTLLLEEEYADMMSNKPLENEEFILTYTMPNESQMKVYNAAKIISEKTGIKVIDISGNPGKTNKKINDNRLCGPDEFLWYMRNAKYIFTNSFHGTAFSVIFEKNFSVIPHSETGNRVTELLEKLNLSSRCANTGIEAAKYYDTHIDYKRVKLELKILQNESINYLKNCIEAIDHKNS